MRLIDADELLPNAIKSKKFVFTVRDALNDIFVAQTIYKDLADFVNNAPTIDAVKVVRCKDCKHWKHFAHLGCTDFVKVCMLANYMIGANGYCSYGERRKE